MSTPADQTVSDAEEDEPPVLEPTEVKSPYWHTVLFVLAPWAVGIAVWLLWVR